MIAVPFYLASIVAPFVVAEALSYFGFPKVGFWLLILYMANSALGLVRALMDPNWYFQNAMSAGVEPNYQQLIFTKILSLGIGALVAWHVGAAARYF